MGGYYAPNRGGVEWVQRGSKNGSLWHPIFQTAWLRPAIVTDWNLPHITLPRPHLKCHPSSYLERGKVRTAIIHPFSGLKQGNTIDSNIGHLTAQRVVQGRERSATPVVGDGPLYGEWPRSDLVLKLIVSRTYTTVTGILADGSFSLASRRYRANQWTPTLEWKEIPMYPHIDQLLSSIIPKRYHFSTLDSIHSEDSVIYYSLLRPLICIQDISILLFLNVCISRLSGAYALYDIQHGRTAWGTLCHASATRFGILISARHTADCMPCTILRCL